MGWEEWDQLKSQVAERHTGMQLNQLPVEPGASGGATDTGGGGTLRHTGKPWNQAADTAGELRTSTSAAKKELTDAHTGVASGAAGLASLGTLTEVLASWEKRIGAVRDECDALEPKLRQVAKDLTGADVAAGGRADAVRAPEGAK